MVTDLSRLSQFGFLLVDGFALMSFAAATEPLRAANLLAGRELFRLRYFGETGGDAVASSGARVPVEALPGAGSGLSTLFVCAGGGPPGWKRPALIACLRNLAREGVRIGGISGGPYLMAAAGLLDRADFTLHWEHAPALAEAFPYLQPRQARYVIDGNRITCGGGVAPLDMMHALIAAEMGEAFARRVSDWYLHTHVEQPGAPQRASLPERYGCHHPGLIRVIERMLASLEAPLSRQSLAQICGVGLRQFDRLFAGELGRSFSEVYMQMRLEHAARLIAQSPLSIAEIAVATGFQNPAHFARRFRRAYGISPRGYRR